MNEAEYYKLTKPERDVWVHEQLLGRETHYLEDMLVYQDDAINQSVKVKSSDDYNVVMQVIEKFHKDGWNWIAGQNDDFVWFQFHKSVIDEHRAYRNAKNFRDAVYLAAGRAKGVME